MSGSFPQNHGLLSANKVVVHRIRSAVLAAVMACGWSGAHATLTATVNVVDDDHLIAGLYDQIASHVGAALTDWGKYIVGDSNIAVEVKVTDSVVRSAGASRASAFIREQNGIAVYGAGTAYKINNGVDVNGDAPDVEILLNPNYARDELWFDPDPFARQALMPADKTDAVSVFLHELGHAIAFNGWGQSPDGKLPGTYASTWDINTEFDGGGLYFIGAKAQAVYGGAVPVTLGNNYHIGNANGDGSDLLTDVMNGVVFYRGQRYGVSALNVAMAEDMGVVVQAVPEPQTIWLMSVGLLILGLNRGAAKRRLTPAQRDYQ